MQRRTRPRAIARYAYGPDGAEAFIIIAIATILITRLYLKLTGYPQVGGGDLHIAHSLYGGALMVVALLIGWLLLGVGARVLGIVLGGVGLGLFLDEVGKFVTKDNDYFYGPAAEIMFIFVVIVLVGTRVVRDIRPLTAQECLASATAIAADGLARGLADHERHLALGLLERARAQGADVATTDQIRALLVCAAPASDHLHGLQRLVSRLIPGFLRSPRLVPVVGWLMVLAAVAGVFFEALGVWFGGYFYRDNVTFDIAGIDAASAALLVSAVLTVVIALPAMIARGRTNSTWPLRWLHNAALIFTFLNALVNFATEGFATLINLAVGLLCLATLTYQLHLRERALGSAAPDAQG
jgi:hypothetical protein